MTNSKELVRYIRNLMAVADNSTFKDRLVEAADLIEAQAAEIEKLKEDVRLLFAREATMANRAEAAEAEVATLRERYETTAYDVQPAGTFQRLNEDVAKLKETVENANYFWLERDTANVARGKAAEAEVVRLAALLARMKEALTELLIAVCYTEPTTAFGPQVYDGRVPVELVVIARRALEE